MSAFVSKCVAFWQLILICYCWYIGDKPLPHPSGATQMTYNNSTATVYIFGGYALNNSDIVFSNKIYKRNLSDTSSVWITLNTTTPTLEFLSQIRNSVIIGNIAYFIGVNNGSYTANQIYLFDMNAEQFINHSIPNYRYAACSGCLATNNTHIFMIGGVNAPLVINYIQILDLKANNWTYRIIDLPFISVGWSHQICNIIKNTLYIFGGVISYPNWESVNVMYKYDVLSSKWLFIGNLSHWTSQGWSLYSNKFNRIYIVVLPKGLGHVTVDVFDVKKESIIFESELLISVWQTPALIYDDILMIFGGYGYYISQGNATFSSFIQMQKLPLIPDGPSSSNDSVTIRKGWFAGIISMSSIICLLIGCCVGIIGYKYVIINNPDHSFHRIM